MSTEIKQMTGKREVYFKGMEKTRYADSTLTLTRYWGGKKKGRMLQLTVSSDFGGGAEYIQLTEKQVGKLVKVLSNVFNDTIYPSE